MLNGFLVALLVSRVQKYMKGHRLEEELNRYLNDKGEWGKGR
jgi:hypothetical protein